MSVETKDLLYLGGIGGSYYLLKKSIDSVKTELSDKVKDLTPAEYVIFTENNVVYAKNGKTGAIEFSGDAKTVLQNVIDNLVSGGKIFIKAGYYLINNTIEVRNSKITIEGEGTATQLAIATGVNPAIKITRDYVTLKRLYITCSDKSNFIIRTEAPAAVVRLENLEISGGGYQIYIVNTPKVWVENCFLYAPGLAGIFVSTDASTQAPKSVLGWIKNTHVTDSNDVGIALVGSGEGREVDAFHIQACQIVKCKGVAIHVKDCGGGMNHIENCDVESTDKYCINIENSPNTRIRGGYYGFGKLGNIRIASSFTTVEDAWCVGAGEHGILLIGVSKCKVAGCIVINNDQEGLNRNGITVSDTTESIIVNNIATDTQTTKTQDYGISEEGTSNYNIIIGNYCRGNKIGGIRTVGTNTIIANNIT